MSMVIGEGKVGIIHLEVKDDAGALIEDTRRGGPMAYLHGKGHIVPGLEKVLDGLEQGSTVTVTCAPADAFGEHNGMDPIAVPKKEMPKDLPLQPGRQFWAQGSDGQHLPMWIDRVVGGKVYVETNHPLAGKTLTFAVEVVAVRDATADELAHGHAHGLDGAAHHH